jgi:hypothetical protein
MPTTPSHFRLVFAAACGIVLGQLSSPDPLTAAEPKTLRVATDFPGGAAEVLDIDQPQHLIRFQVPETKTEALRSWWYMHVTGITPGTELKLELVFGKSKAQRASYSTDQRTWLFTEPATENEQTGAFLYRQKINAKEAWFAWYQPYLLANAEELVNRVSRRPHVTKFVLCQSEANRPVWGVRIAEPGVPDDHRFGVWIQARQHAWETGGSWTAHGLIEWLSSDDPQAIALRRKASITVIPIMDVDSVEAGLGGKWQTPHDHNRDWSDQPHWKAVQAAQKELKQLDAAGSLDIALDLHDPGWEGVFEFWCNPYPVMKGIRRRNTDRFLGAAKQHIVGPLKFDPEVYSPYTIDTPTAGNWLSQRTRPHVVGGTCEIGVCPPSGFQGQPPSFQLTAGRELGITIERYLDARNRRDE